MYEMSVIFPYVCANFHSCILQFSSAQYIVRYKVDREMTSIAGITIAPQTKVAFLGYLLLAVSMIMTFIYRGWSYDIGRLAIFVLTVLLALYVLNCTVLGKCIIDAWIVAYIVAVFGILFGMLFLTQEVWKA